MKVRCPGCQQELEYKPNAQQKRRRKHCPCGRWFDIKAIPAPATKMAMTTPQQAKLAMGKIASMGVRLDARDHELVKLASTGHGQAVMAKHLGISGPATCKRLERLVAAGVLVKVSSRPRVYNVNPSFIHASTASPAGITYGTGAHNIHVRCDVRDDPANMKKYEALLATKGTMAKMKNWVKKYFQEGGVHFELNPQCIVFHVKGFGVDEDLAKDNAKIKAERIRTSLETRFNVNLSFPVFKESQIHYTPMGVPTSAVKTLEEEAFWGDKSHPGLVETNSPLISARIRKVVDGSLEGMIQQVITAQDQIAAAVTTMATVNQQATASITSLATMQQQLVSNLSTLSASVQQLVALAGSGGRGPPMDHSNEMTM